MISASKTTFRLKNFKILRSKVTKNLMNSSQKFCESPHRSIEIVIIFIGTLSGVHTVSRIPQLSLPDLQGDGDSLIRRARSRYSRNHPGSVATDR